jgi:hypothetical protein
MTTVYVANKNCQNIPFDIYPSVDGKTMSTFQLDVGSKGEVRFMPQQVMKTITIFGAYHESRGVTYLDSDDWDLIEKFYTKNHVTLKSGAIKCFKTAIEAEKYLKDKDTQLIDLGNTKLTEKDLTIIDNTKFAYNEDFKNKVVS